MEINQIIKYFGGDCSDAERQAIESWVEASDGNRQTFDRIKAIWDAMENTSGTINPDLRMAWKNIARETGIDKHSRRISISIVLKIAAIVIMVIGLSFLAREIFFVKPVSKSEITSATDKKNLVLADGTEIFLNRNSRITFPEKFTGNSREIILEGEAFFHVAKDPEHPFIVHANGTIIEVLGTSFNIKANKEVQVSVMTGKVAFYPENNSAKSIRMERGEQGNYNIITHELSKQVISDENVLAWKTGIIVFNNKTLDEVAKVLTEFYAERIELEDGLKDRRITVSFNNLQFKEALQVLRATLNIEVVYVSGKTILKTSEKN